MKAKKRSKKDRSTGEIEISSPPSSSYDDPADLCDINIDSSPEQRHILLETDDGYRHIWLVGESEREHVTAVKPSDLSGIIALYADQLYSRSDHSTMNGGMLRFQSFGSTAFSIDPDPVISVMREDDLINLRLDSGDDRYTIIYDTRPSITKIGSYAVSRLGSKGCIHVPDLLGISYWERPSGPLAWSSLVRHGVDSHPSFRPFLRDLDDILSSILSAGPESYHDYIIKLSRNLNRRSFLLSRDLGRSLGAIHGNLIIGRKEASPRASGMLGERIARMLSVDEFSMEDIGSILGMVSSYLSRTNRVLRTRSGIEGIRSDSGRRRLKVVKKRSPPSGEVMSTSLRILSRGFVGRESAIKNRFSRLREFRGSPSITSMLDSRLEKVVIENGSFIFDNFNWFPPGFEDDLFMMMPLKDIAMSLNSLMKSRYLSARKILRRLSSDFNVDMSSLESMYIDYNLSKRNYETMRRDLTISRLLSDGDSPFGSILAISVASALWFDRCRNEIISGYTGELEDSGRIELLDYPGGVNTLDGIDLLQIFISLSELSRYSEMDEMGISTVGRESALLTVLTR